jgi:hypothetical protein
LRKLLALSILNRLEALLREQRIKPGVGAPASFETDVDANPSVCTKSEHILNIS